jgi:hypothetical protein
MRKVIAQAVIVLTLVMSFGMTAFASSIGTLPATAKSRLTKSIEVGWFDNGGTPDVMAVTDNPELQDMIDNKNGIAFYEDTGRSRDFSKADLATVLGNLGIGANVADNWVILVAGTVNVDENGSGLGSQQDFHRWVIVYDKEYIETLVGISDDLSDSSVDGNMEALKDGLNVDVDIAGAAAVFSGVTPIINLICGIILFVVTLIFSVMMAMEIAYIEIPAFRGKMEDVKQSGTNKVMTKSDGNGGTKLRLIGADAIKAVEIEVSGEGGSKWMYYIKKKLVGTMFLGISIYVLASGNLTLFIDLAIRVVQGGMKVIQGLT